MMRLTEKLAVVDCFVAGGDDLFYEYDGMMKSDDDV